MRLLSIAAILLAALSLQTQAREPETSVYTAQTGEKLIVARKTNGDIYLQVKNAKSILNELTLSYKAEPFDAEVDLFTTLYGRKYVLLMASIDYDAPFQLANLVMHLPENSLPIELSFSETETNKVKLSDLARLEKSQSLQISMIKKFNPERAQWLEEKKLPQYGYVKNALQRFKNKCGRDISVSYDWRHTRPEMLEDAAWAPAKIVAGGVDGLGRVCESSAEMKAKVAKLDALVIQPDTTSTLRLEHNTLYLVAKFDHRDGHEEFFVQDNFSSTVK